MGDITPVTMLKAIIGGRKTTLGIVRDNLKEDLIRLRDRAQDATKEGAGEGAWAFARLQASMDDVRTDVERAQRLAEEIEALEQALAIIEKDGQ